MKSFAEWVRVLLPSRPDPVYHCNYPDCERPRTQGARCHLHQTGESTAAQLRRVRRRRHD